MVTRTIERPLTESDYRQRRSSIERELAETRNRSREAQLRLVRGEIDDEEAAAIASTVISLERRLSGIDQAWNESERIFGEATSAARAKARRRAVAAIRQLDVDRLEIVRKINDTIAGLSPLVDALLATESAMLAALEPFRRDLSREDGRDLARAIKDHAREADVFRSTLAKSGLQLLGAVPSGPTNDHTFETIVAWRQPIQRYLDQLDEMN